MHIPNELLSHEYAGFAGESTDLRDRGRPMVRRRFAEEEHMRIGERCVGRSVLVTGVAAVVMISVRAQSAAGRLASLARRAAGS